MGMMSEFKAFAMRGNVIDLAVGVVIGAAFGKIVSSLVDQIIMPPIGLMIGGVDFSAYKWVLKAGGPDGKGEVALQFGAFFNTIIQFAIVALATVPFALATPTTNEVLLMAALLVRGFGLGAVTIPLMSVAFLGLDRADVPHASTITRIATQVGGSFGVAVLAVILHAAMSGARAPGDVAAAFDRSFWWAIAFAGAAVLLSFLLPGRPEAQEPVVAAVEPERRAPTVMRSRWAGSVKCASSSAPNAASRVAAPFGCTSACSMPSSEYGAGVRKRMQRSLARPATQVVPGRSGYARQRCSGSWIASALRAASR